MVSKFKKINSLILLTAIILSFVVSFIPQKVNALDWYNTSWLYRKSITISGTTAGVQTNYQLPIHVYYTSTNTTSGTENINLSGGGATTKTFGRLYLNGKCQTDFDDLRFTKSDGITLIDYWVESYTSSTNATIWVEFDYVPASPSTQTFYVYYGNSTVASVSSGTNTFSEFEDFEWSTNATSLGTDGGSINWTVSIGGTSVAEISTTQAWGGTRSARLYRDGANNVSAYFTKAAADNYAVMLRVRKDDNTQISSVQGNGVYRRTVIFETDEDIVYYNGGYVDTTYNIGINTWTLFEYINTRFSAGTFTMYMNNVSIANATMWANAGTNNLIFHQIDSGTGVTYLDNIIVRNYCNPEPTFSTWGAEEYFSVGSYLAIQNVKVFESYRQSGDWIFTIRYLNLYPPYYDTYDIRKLFVFQLRDLTGTVRSQAPLIAWGNRVGNLYMAASEVGALDYGENYVIRIYGLFGSNPYVDYTLLDSDWQGSDLTNLDSWVVSSASVISDYYSTDLTSYNAQRGEVLNATGATIFDQGINGLSKVRPDIFESSSGQGGYTDKTHTQTGRVNDWATAVGPDFAAWFGNIGGIVGQDGLFAIRLICIIFFFVIQMYCCIPNHNIAANVLGVPFIAGLWYFGLEIIWVAMLAIIAAGLFALQFWIHK